MDKKTQKISAIFALQTLKIFKSYIDRFKDENKICFFENYCGFWAYQEPELMAKIKEFEEKHNALVYAVTHEHTEFGECYDFLYIPDHVEEFEELLSPAGNMFYVYAYVWNKTDDFCSEFGTIGIQSFGGGIKRIM